MRGRKLIGVALWGALMAGCSDGVLIHSEVLHTGDVRSHLVYAVTDSSVQTRIQNNPFQSSKDVLDLTVTRAMDGRHQDVATIFAVEPEGVEPRLYNLIIRFEPPDSLSGAELCQGNEGPPADSVAGRIRVLGAFCLADEVLSEAKGEVGNVKGVDDPAFRRLIQQVLLALFPPGESEFPEAG